MEYIEGRSIDRHRLSVRERLDLFLEVCEAVHFAHHNLVIHRDLKPSNILITRDGTPKLLEFGIAKLLQVDGPEPVIRDVASSAADSCRRCSTRSEWRVSTTWRMRSARLVSTW